VDGAGVERCCFDDWVDDWVTAVRTKEVARPLTASLLEALVRAGVRDRSVLDLGCGIGDLSIAAVGRGAARATGFDLSPKAIDEARRLAARRGVADRTSFEVGDAAETDLPGADVVVLHRVFCCYPRVTELLERSLGAAAATYAFTTPASGGVVGAWNRVRNAISNAWYAARPAKFLGFRSYVHDVDEIDSRLREAGFDPVHRERRRLVWDLAVYRRG